MLTRLRLRLTAERRLIALAAVIVAVQAIVIANRRLTQGGDFDVSREFGRRFTAGEPLYAGGLHYPYMPTAALYFAPLAMVPPWLGLALRYAAALGALWLTLRLLHTMVGARGGARPIALAVPTLVLASHYILRDLDDGGPHLILLAMLVSGIYSVGRGRAVAGAVWLGLAAALKIPNALFIPFFVWKRQWRLAALTAAALLAWTVLPAAWMGPARWWEHQREWLGMAVASASGVPSGGAKDSEERVQNQALRPTLARYGGATPAPAAVPRALAMAVTVAVLAGFGWWSRRRWVGSGDPAWPVEASALLILSLLLSPVAWVQHLVLVIPAVYLIVAAARSGPSTLRRAQDSGRTEKCLQITPPTVRAEPVEAPFARRSTISLGGPAMAAMTTYFVLAVLLNREIVGRDRYLFLLAHGLHTLCLLLLLAVLCAQRPAPAVRTDPPPAG